MKKYATSLLTLSLFLLPCLVFANDPPTPQVIIESRIVQARDNFERELGIEWGFGPVVSHMTGERGNGSAVGLTAFAGMDVLLNPRLSAFTHVKFTQFGDKSKFGNSSYVYKVGAFGVDGGIKLHLIPTPSSVVDPFIIVGADVAVNAFGRQKYKINDVKETEFFKLNNNDNRVFAGIRGGAGVTIRTDVVDLTAQFVVIGGLIPLVKEQSDRSVPLLFEIPVIGRLFRSKEKQRNRDEVIIFITPRIIKEEP
ncbi:MAG: hypothetical protein GY751_05650 [Bacteroidetes bacterium]|nr:hypothetical protein [Bacteroidota bacterium]